MQDGVEQIREEIYDRLERVRNDVSELVGDSMYSEMEDTNRVLHKTIRRSRLRYKKLFGLILPCSSCIKRAESKHNSQPLGWQSTVVA